MPKLVDFEFKANLNILGYVEVGKLFFLRVTFHVTADCENSQS